MFWLADLVLAIHFALAAFVASGLLLIPMGQLEAFAVMRT